MIKVASSWKKSCIWLLYVTPIKHGFWFLPNLDIEWEYAYKWKGYPEYMDLMDKSKIKVINWQSYNLQWLLPRAWFPLWVDVELTCDYELSEKRVYSV